MNRFGFDNLGFGMGLRTTHYDHVLSTLPKVDWFEVISENFMDTDGKPKRILERVLEHYPVILHGVSMSIGSTDPLNKDYLAKLKRLIEWVNPPWVSDHVCWTGIQKKNTHDLLPVPYTEEALQHMVDRVKQVQDYLGRPLILENPSTYMEFTDSQMPEWEFIARMTEESDCGLLLDANNVYVTCYNHRLDPKEYIDALPADRVVQIHLAGHDNMGTHIVDTHKGNVIDDVWTIYRYILSHTGPVSTMIEWDDAIPEFDVVFAEVQKAKAFAENLEVPNNIPSFKGDSPIILNTGEAEQYGHLLQDLQTPILSGDIAAATPDRWIKAKENFAPKDQLGVYVNGYRYRLFDISNEDYPLLRYYLGNELMNETLDAYIEAHPSEHFNIAHYTEAFPAFVKGYTPIDETWRGCDFAYEVALLETELSQIFHFEETVPLEGDTFKAVDPEAFLSVVLSPRKALKLFSFDYPVNQFLEAFNADEQPDAPEKEESFLAVYRHNDVMWRLPLMKEEYALLKALFSGKPVGEAIETLLEEGNVDSDYLMDHIQGWFGRWLHNGLLAHKAA